MNFNPWFAGPIFACVAIPLLFGLILKTLSVLGGWSELAKSYQADRPPPYPRLRMQNAVLGSWCGYNNCLTLAADADALYMSIVFPFGFGHPGLKLPWAEAKVEQTTPWFGGKRTTFTFERAPNVKIQLSATVAEQLVALAQQAREYRRLEAQ